MLNGIILTRGALEVAEEVRRYLELDEEGGDQGSAPATPGDEDQIEFAVLLSEAAMAQRKAAVH